MEGGGEKKKRDTIGTVTTESNTQRQLMYKYSLYL